MLDRRTLGVDDAGLSSGDRCRLVLAARLSGPAVTAWTSIEVGVDVLAIR